MTADSVIFDLDGTLWDATGVTAETWVRVMERHPGVVCAEKLDRAAVKKYMGLTNEELAKIFFPTLKYEEAFRLMMESCELENLWLPHRGGILYPKTSETLTELKKHGLRLFIVSNCQDGYIESFLTAHKMYAVFEDWESSGRSGKSKAENITDVAQRNFLSSPVYVGDTVSDSVGARCAGVPFIYAKYGFGEENGRGRTDDFDDAIESISDLPELLREKY